LENDFEVNFFGDCLCSCRQISQQCLLKGWLRNTAKDFLNYFTFILVPESFSPTVETVGFFSALSPEGDVAQYGKIWV